jgi:hypothetical protein
MNSSPLDDELTPLFPEVTIHHVASDSEVERLIQNTDENCTVIVIDTEQTFTKTQTSVILFELFDASSSASFESEFP